MGYFRELPNIEYQSTLPDRNGSDSYIRVKNLFRRVKLREDLQNITTVFNKYAIPDNYRPDLVAEDLYGRADLDWVVLLSANIISVRDQWPLSNRELYNFVVNKYGVENLSAIKFYETTEVKDSQGRLIIPAGKVVDSQFTIPKPDTMYQEQIEILNPVVGITNYEYETRKNEEKRLIYVLKKSYLQQFLNDMRKIMNYDRSSQYVNPTLVRTENTRNTLP
jgi:hypothetical protein